MSIDVPLEDRPKQNEWKHTTLLRKEDTRDRLIMFFDEEHKSVVCSGIFLIKLKASFNLGQKSNSFKYARKC